MRILVLATSEHGGAGIAARRSAEALRRSGVETVLVTRESTTGGIDEYQLNFDFSLGKKLLSKVTTFLQSKLIQSDSDLITSLSVNIFPMDILDIVKPDLIHIHAFYNLIDTKFLHELGEKRIPVVITMHDQRLFTGGCHYSGKCTKYLFSCESCFQVTKSFRWLPPVVQQKMKHSLNEIERIVVVSPSLWLKNIAIQSSVLNNVRIEVLENPIPDIFSVDEYEDNSRWDDQGSVLGFVASNFENPLKGFNLFCNAINHLTGRLPSNLRINVIGEGNISNFDLNIPYSITLANNEALLAEAFRQIDLLVVPSLQDNYPNILGEALMSGKTILGSNVGGIPEALNVFGMPTIDPKNSRAFAESIFNTLLNLHQPIEVSNHARNLYSYDVHARKLCGLYESILR